MKRFFYLAAILGPFLGIMNGFAQQTNYSLISTELPKKWILKENSPSTYLVTTTHFNYNMIGPFIDKMQITGEFTRGLENGNVKWNNVKIAHAKTIDGDFDNRIIQPVMEGFKYVPSKKMMNESEYASFPMDERSYLFKNLVWDMMGFEAFAWSFSDSLKLNKEFKAQSFNEKIDLAGHGTFENKDIRLTWIGNTLKNGKECIIIKFSVLNNPLSMISEQLKLKGRSHYWGNIYVCINTKQIEYGELYEDVIMEMQIAGKPNPQHTNVVRTIFVERDFCKSQGISNK